MPGDVVVQSDTRVEHWFDIRWTADTVLQGLTVGTTTCQRAWAEKLWETERKQGESRQHKWRFTPLVITTRGQMDRRSFAALRNVATQGVKLVGVRVEDCLSAAVLEGLLVQAAAHVAMVRALPADARDAREHWAWVGAPLAADAAGSVCADTDSDIERGGQAEADEAAADVEVFDLDDEQDDAGLENDAAAAHVGSDQNEAARDTLDDLLDEVEAEDGRAQAATAAAAASTDGDENGRAGDCDECEDDVDDDANARPVQETDDERDEGCSDAAAEHAGSATADVMGPAVDAADCYDGATA